jgi:hypothetical protein
MVGAVVRSSTWVNITWSMRRAVSGNLCSSNGSGSLVNINRRMENSCSHVGHVSIRYSVTCMDWYNSNSDLVSFGFTTLNTISLVVYTTHMTRRNSALPCDTEHKYILFANSIQQLLSNVVETVAL